MTDGQTDDQTDYVFQPIIHMMRVPGGGYSLEFSWDESYLGRMTPEAYEEAEDFDQTEDADCHEMQIALDNWCKAQTGTESTAITLTYFPNVPDMSDTGAVQQWLTTPKGSS